MKAMQLLAPGPAATEAIPPPHHPTAEACFRHTVTQEIICGTKDAVFTMYEDDIAFLVSLSCAELNSFLWDEEEVVVLVVEKEEAEKEQEEQIIPDLKRRRLATRTEELSDTEAKSKPKTTGKTNSSSTSMAAGRAAVMGAVWGLVALGCVVSWAL